VLHFLHFREYPYFRRVLFLSPYDSLLIPIRISFGELYNGQLILPASWQGLWTAFVQFGVMVGAFCNGFLQDRFGRKASYACGALATAIGKHLPPSVETTSHKEWN
jgi:MFS family permease